MLIDDITISVAAGNGGRGAVAFNKNMLSLGPAGGSGGDGGNIYCEGVSDLGALRQFRFKKKLNAANGENGKPQFNEGKTGANLILKIPVGTIIHNLENGNVQEITKINERVIVTK